MRCAPNKAPVSASKNRLDHALGMPRDNGLAVRVERESDPTPHRAIARILFSQANTRDLRKAVGTARDSIPLQALDRMSQQSFLPRSSPRASLCAQGKVRRRRRQWRRSQGPRFAGAHPPQYEASDPL